MVGWGEELQGGGVGVRRLVYGEVGVRMRMEVRR